MEGNGSGSQDDHDSPEWALYEAADHGSSGERVDVTVQMAAFPEATETAQSAAWYSSCYSLSPAPGAEVAQRKGFETGLIVVGVFLGDHCQCGVLGEHPGSRRLAFLDLVGKRHGCDSRSFTRSGRRGRNFSGRVRGSLREKKGLGSNPDPGWWRSSEQTSRGASVGRGKFALAERCQTA